MKLRFVIAVMAIGLISAAIEIGFCADTVNMSEFAQLLEKIGTNGNVNWSAGYIEAVGIGAPPAKFSNLGQARAMALRAAEVVAKRNLLEIINGVRIDSTTIIKDFAVQSDIINSQVQGLILGAQVIKQEYMSDQSCEVTVRMPLYGDFSKIIMPKVLDSKTAAKPPAATPAPPEKPKPAAAPPSGPAYTGLVIDARGIQTRPAMAPKILDENGQEVYGSAMVDREFAVQQGMSGYARDLTAAQNNGRVTNNPLTVKGIRTQGAGRSDIVISNSDAAAIRAASDNLSFMKKCRVMVVLD